MSRKRPGIIHAALRDEWDGLERITRDLRVADAFTLLNCLAGIAAMLLAASGRPRLAVVAITIGIVLDGLDGAVARIGRSWGGGPLGPPLDSLADAITFVAAPAVVAASSAHGIDGPWWLLVTASWYAAAGLLRLARFETLRKPERTRYFSGLPSPAAALAVVAALRFPGAPTGAVAVVLFGAGTLMASRVRYPKLKGILGAVTLLPMIGLVATLGTPWEDLGAQALAAFLAVFLVAGPFYVLRRVGPTPPPEPAP